MNAPSLRFTTAALLMFAFAPGTQAGSITINGQADGPTPFIKVLDLTVSDAAELAHMEYKIDPMTGSDTRPVGVRYSKTYLLGREFLDPDTGAISLPVFGLYADHANQVTLVSTFTDQTTQRDHIGMQTPVWNDPSNVYLNPRIQQAKSSHTSLSFDFIMLANKNLTNTPVIIDTDARVRWVGTTSTRSSGTVLFDNGIYASQNIDTSTTHVLRLEFDGTFSALGNPAVDPGGIHNYRSDGVTAFHHTIDPGKTGILVEAHTDAVPALGTDAQRGSVILEIDPADGTILERWDFADIFRAAISAAGEDPAGFVFGRNDSPANWFHSNAACYRSSDNTLIVSSRENFVVAVDYDTKEIKWLLGDPTKAWYVNYPLSLQPKALALGPGTSAPIGQHAVSIQRDRLLLFDNGSPSKSHTPEGAEHSSSAVVRKYMIDLPQNMATEIWTHVADPPIAAPFTSSVYEDAPGNFLIDYGTIATLVGLDSSGDTAFQFSFPGGSSSMHNARPVHFEFMEFN